MRTILTIIFILIASTAFASIILEQPVTIGEDTGAFADILYIKDSGWNLFIEFRIYDINDNYIGPYDCNIENNDYNRIIELIDMDDISFLDKILLTDFCT